MMRTTNPANSRRYKFGWVGVPHPGFNGYESAHDIVDVCQDV